MTDNSHRFRPPLNPCLHHMESSDGHREEAQACRCFLHRHGLLRLQRLSVISWETTLNGLDLWVLLLFDFQMPRAGY